MAERGWVRDAEGFWSKEGQRVRVPIEGYLYICQDVGTLLAAQLRAAGFEASYKESPDFYPRMARGQALAFLTGMSSSVRDPQATLRNFHGRYVRPTGQFAGANRFWRWKDPAYDLLMDRMDRYPAQAPEYMACYRQAMEIWLKALPCIPLAAWHQRVPYNQTFWKGWPSAPDPYTSGAYWHQSFILTLLRLQPVRP
jgi:peptide/nickel transport system substrate-binding protein